MVALFAFDPVTAEVVPIDLKPRLCHLLLKAQQLEKMGVLFYFQLGYPDEEVPFL